MPLERKTDSYLKDIITECWIELGCDFMGIKRNWALSVKITMVPEALTVGSQSGKETQPSFGTPKPLKIKEMFWIISDLKNLVPFLCNLNWKAWSNIK